MFHIFKVYPDKSEARHHSCTTLEAAKAYINYFAIEAAGRGELLDKTDTSVTVNRDGNTLVYEARE